MTTEKAAYAQLDSGNEPDANEGWSLCELKVSGEIIMITKIIINIL